ncbi:glycoside hydrolase family 2 protein [Halalkalibacter kiskunsagensis]|uniref:Glycoside hydrolase family 2 protein n=1 Tax=Halalkalibacter kiskunsagensis TaxID=1548599 RepID=A0ABV6KFK5_9BACI
MNVPRKEYPRPNFQRNDWLNLNGQWEFTFDDKNIGLDEKWYVNRSFSDNITVPFAFQTQLSGIEETKFHDVVWYRKSFAVPNEWQEKRLLLHFQAVDYRATVWVNGIQVATHEGGGTPFHADITPALKDKNNHIVVRAEDLSTDLAQPRGKQFWEEKSAGIFYTRTTGIWQTVWLEPISPVHIERLKLTPNIDEGEVIIDYYVQNSTEIQEIEIEVSYKGNVVGIETAALDWVQRKNVHTIQLADFQKGEGKLWSPESPNLYDVTARLIENEQIVDEVKSYFGMRKIAVENGMVQLNNKPYYMKLVLDQGYYPESLLTAPDDESLKKDIELTKAMGFNGVRKHQKIEEPRYLYWADKLGLLVWGEMANAHTFSDPYIKRITAEWQEAIERDYNHPSIVAWVPLNESWGVPRLKRDPRQGHHAMSLYYLTKSLDATRVVISNDGWEHVKSDLLTIHDYEGEKEVLKERYSKVEHALAFQPADRSLFVKGYTYQSEPIFVSEFGGIAYQKSEWQGWGYTSADNDEDFLKRYESVISALLESPLVQGFCYTQLTDVEQEINGLLTYDRKPKVDLDLIRTINEGKSITTKQ